MAFPIEIVGEGIDWPAWVQAVGSIVAILFSTGLAILVPAWQRDVATRDARGAAIAASFDLVRWIAAGASIAPKTASALGLLTVVDEAIVRANNALGSIPLTSLGGEKAVANVMALRSIAAAAHSAESKVYEDGITAAVELYNRCLVEAVTEFEAFAKHLHRTRKLTRSELVASLGSAWPSREA